MSFRPGGMNFLPSTSPPALSQVHSPLEEARGSMLVGHALGTGIRKEQALSLLRGRGRPFMFGGGYIKEHVQRSGGRAIGLSSGAPTDTDPFLPLPWRRTNN